MSTVENIFSHLVVCLFTFIRMSFGELTFLSVMSSLSVYLYIYDLFKELFIT